MTDDNLAARRRLESILGGSLDVKPTLPGLEPRPGEGVLYLELPGPDAEGGKRFNRIKKLFNQVVRAHEPLLMTGGAASSGNWVLTTPVGTRYFSVSYRGDLNGWRQQLTQGAKLLGLKYGVVEPPSFVDSEGAIALLSDCITEIG